MEVIIKPSEKIDNEIRNFLCKGLYFFIVKDDNLENNYPPKRVSKILLDILISIFNDDNELELLKQAYITKEKCNKYSKKKSLLLKMVGELHRKGLLTADDYCKFLLPAIESLIKIISIHRGSPKIFCLNLELSKFREFKESSVIEIFSKLRSSLSLLHYANKIAASVSPSLRRTLLNEILNSDTYSLNIIELEYYALTIDEIRCIAQTYPQFEWAIDRRFSEISRKASKETKIEFLNERIKYANGYRVYLYPYNLSFDKIKELLVSYPETNFDCDRIIYSYSENQYDVKYFPCEQSIFILKYILDKTKNLEHLDYKWITLKGKVEILDYAIENNYSFNIRLIDNIDKDYRLKLLLKAIGYNYSNVNEEYIGKLSKNTIGFFLARVIDRYQDTEIIVSMLKISENIWREKLEEVKTEFFYNTIELIDKICKVKNYSLGKLIKYVDEQRINNQNDALLYAKNLKWLNYLWLSCIVNLKKEQINLLNNEISDALIQLWQIRPYQIKFRFTYELIASIKNDEFRSAVYDTLTRVPHKYKLISIIVTGMLYKEYNTKAIVELMKKIPDFSKDGANYNTILSSLMNIQTSKDLSVNGKFGLIKNIFSFNIQFKDYNSEYNAAQITAELGTWHKNNPSTNSLLITRSICTPDNFFIVEQNQDSNYKQLTGYSAPEIIKLLHKSNKTHNKLLEKLNWKQKRYLEMMIMRKLPKPMNIVLLTYKNSNDENILDYCKKMQSKIKPGNKLIIIQQPATYYYSLAGTNINGDQIILPDLKCSKYKELLEYLKFQSQHQFRFDNSKRIKRILAKTGDFEVGKSFIIQSLMFTQTLFLLKSLDKLNKEALKNYTFRQTLNNILQNLFNIKEDIECDFLSTFEGCDNLSGLAIYYLGLSTIPGTEKNIYTELVKEYIKRVATKNHEAYKRLRYQNNPQLTKSFKLLPALEKKWPEGSLLNLIDFIKAHNITSGKIRTMQEQLFDSVYQSVVIQGHLSSELFPNLHQYLKEPNANVKFASDKYIQTNESHKKIEQSIIALLKDMSKLSKVEIIARVKNIKSTCKDKDTAEFCNDLGSFLDTTKQNKNNTNIPSNVAIRDTDNFWLMLMMGTHVSGSCQRVDGKPEYNKALIGGFVLSGHVRMIAIVDGDGIIKARAVIKLLTEDNSQKPALFLEQIYPGNINSLYKNAIIEFAKLRGEQLGVSVFKHESNAEKKESEKSLSCEYVNGCEYVDALRGIKYEGYTIENISYLYNAELKAGAKLETLANASEPIPAAALRIKHTH